MDGTIDWHQNIIDVGQFVLKVKYQNILETLFNFNPQKKSSKIFIYWHKNEGGNLIDGGM